MLIANGNLTSINIITLLMLNPYKCSSVQMFFGQNFNEKRTLHEKSLIRLLVGIKTAELSNAK